MSASDDKTMLAKAEVLIEALPYFQRYAGRTFVVKYGGHAMGDPELARDFAEDIVLLKAVGINPVVVHGGGPQIGAMLKKLGVESKFVDGLRVTDKATAEIAEMVLCGAINKELVGWIAQAGGKALGISGKDGGLVTATKVTRTTKDPESNIEQAVDLGFVGEPSKVDTTILETASKSGMIPVVAPIGAGEGGETYNINADTMAGAIAAALGAARLFLLTDVTGVLGKDGTLLTDLTPADIGQLRADGTISGGMIPKLETCVHAVEAGCEAAVVLDGRVPHAMLLEFFTSRGAGTLISGGVMRGWPFVLPVLALAACQAPSGTATSEAPTVQPAASEPATATPSPGATPDFTPRALTPEAAKGEKGARNVLLSWARAIEDRSFAAAYALYGKNGPASGESEADFAAGFARYNTIAVALGDGQIEGAAGSSYYEVPVTLSGTAQGGAAYKRSGTITMRRVNDVPGAEPWQLLWHVERIEWKD